MKPGQRVSHPAFGVGVVSAVNLTGQRSVACRLRLYAGWIVLEALEVLSRKRRDGIGASYRR